MDAPTKPIRKAKPDIKPKKRVTQKKGDAAESHAWHWLIQQGLRPVKRNYRCRLGEIDLILLDGDTLAFVEVRRRKNQTFGGAAQSVTYHKQQKIIKTAQHFLMSHPNYQSLAARFDVIAYESAPEEIAPIWYKGAFTL
jgi:putative endonuclease